MSSNSRKNTLLEAVSAKEVIIHSLWEKSQNCLPHCKDHFMSFKMGFFLKKGNFPLLSIIKPISPKSNRVFIGWNEFCPLDTSAYQLCACPNRRLSKQLAGLDKMQYSSKPCKDVPCWFTVSRLNGGLFQTQRTSICWCCCCCHFSHVQLSVTLWTAARQAPLSRGFSRQEYWGGLPCSAQYVGEQPPNQSTLQMAFPFQFCRVIYGSEKTTFYF